MPFIGRDWRSPGEAWIKTDTLGWQRMKLIESQLHQSCHQNPACSWPPRNEYGQHMAKNCHENFTNNANSPDDHQNNISSSTSSDYSRGGSLSPSPTSSPEKNLRNVYPVTISSPYGRYSCCSHLIEYGSVRPSLDNSADNCLSNAQLLTRSLSRESVRSGTKPSPVQKLRYNNSVPDFKTSSSTDNYTTNLRRDAAHLTSDDKINLNVPVLMRDGVKISDAEVQGPFGDDHRGIDKLPQNHPNSCCCVHAQNAHNMTLSKESPMKTAPHCRIAVKTREVAMYNTISEAFYRLDFCNAIHDIRRFNYICKLLHLLITQNLTSLSGCATKVLFTMLEQVAWEVSSNKRNIHVLKNLLNELRQMIQKYYCWGRPIGSSLLWQQHFDTIERISQIVDGIELVPPKSNTPRATFNNLPVEMIREILLRLNDYRDLVNSAQASPVMRTMVDSQYIWKKLCKYHFTEQQLKMALENSNELLLKRGSARGVKYARTSSADGRSSYRNPVMHKPKRVSTTRQQLEQTSCRRGSRQCEDNDEPSTSYVTRAIQIFDKENSSTKVKKTVTNKQVKEKCDLSAGQRLDTDRHEVDWERIFHQLRKKFDLREEYADCLLLCRHCRCLFWKSFGHPCIEQQLESTPKSLNRDDIGQPSVCDSNPVQQVEPNRSVNRPEEFAPNYNEPQPSSHNQRRISVAMLSRNFDANRAQGSNLPRASAEHQASIPGLDQPRRPLSQRNDNSGTRRPNQGSTTRNAELIPKHVAISPQAFLKFFSL